MKIHISLPIETISEANTRDGWRKKAQRVKNQRFEAKVICRNKYPNFKLLREDKLEIKLTRVSIRTMDDDNLCSALKAVRDGIADWLRIDDGSERIKWVYAQEKMRRCNFVKLDITIED